MMSGGMRVIMAIARVIGVNWVITSFIMVEMVITRFLRATTMIAQLRVIMSIARFVADSMVVTRFVRVILIIT